MIELIDVSRTVHTGAGPLTILHATSLQIAKGQVVAIAGPSGSGKSTLLGLIAGLDAPTTGTIIVDGVTVTSRSEEQLARLRGEKIGIVFQFFHLLPSLTALENILVPMEIAGAPDAHARAKTLLADVGLADRGHHYPSQLSGGEQQRVALARALLRDPEPAPLGLRPRLAPRFAAPSLGQSPAATSCAVGPPGPSVRPMARPLRCSAARLDPCFEARSGPHS